MLFVYLLIIVLAAVLLKIFRMLLKRIKCLVKIKKHWRGEIIFLRNPFVSVFVRDGKYDLVLKHEENEYYVAIFTTPFRKVRYHFENGNVLKIIVERRGVYVNNYKRAYGNTTTMDHCFTIRKYGLKLDDGKEADLSKNGYMILYPAPIQITKVSGNSIVVAGNNDILCGNIRITGLKYFISHFSDLSLHSENPDREMEN